VRRGDARARALRGGALRRGDRGGLGVLDGLLLATLLPVCVVALALHVREIVRTGLAQPPVFAVGRGGDAYPVVGGERYESVERGSTLRAGDRLIRLGDEDLRGVGHIGFDAIALEKAGRGLSVPLVYERDGRRHQLDLELRSRPLPWSRLPPMLGMVVITTILLLRSGGAPGARRLFLAFLSLAIMQSVFSGGPRWQTDLSQGIWNYASPLVVFLMLRWATLFPDEVPDEDRPSPAWAVLGAALHATVRASYLWGVPIPAPWVPRISIASNALFLLGTIALLVWNYRHADPVGRRRAKWVLTGGAVGAAGMAAVQLLPLVVPGYEGFPALFALSMFPTIAAPVGVWIAVTRFNAFDVDRIISAAASYTLLLIALVGGALALVSTLSATVADVFGVELRVAQLALAVATAGIAVPLAAPLRRRVDRVFFPEREALERGAEQLLEDLSDCRSPGEVFELIGDRVTALLRPRSCAVYTRQAGHFAPRAFVPGDAPPVFPAGDPLAEELSGRVRAVVVRDRGRSRSRSEIDAGLLAGLRASVLVPLHSGVDLAAFAALGPKRSGDVYTTGDLSLLSSLAERGSAELLRIRDARVLESERAHVAELDRLRGKADEANRSKSRLLAAASHDLRQPLQALGLFVASLDREIDSPELRAEVRSIQAATRDLGERMNALLDVSRLDVGAVEPEVADFPLEPLCERLRSELGPAAREAGLAMKIDAGGAWARSDPALVARILQQLVENALRFSEHGEVELRCERRGEELWIEVRDTGPGIPAERQREIFQEFVRLDPRRGGLGLGLSIAQKLARLLGHRLELVSRPGAGSLFRLCLPAGRPEAAVRETAPGPGAELAGRLVAVVDDDLAILGAMRQMLEGWGCEVVLAASGDELLESLEARGRAPDLVVSDWRLHGEERGSEVVERLRRSYGSGLPAALVTGESTGEHLRQLRRLGDPVLAKPVSPARLRALMHELLRRPA
jgi:signal transduction histidine kinase